MFRESPAEGKDMLSFAQAKMFARRSAVAGAAASCLLASAVLAGQPASASALRPAYTEASWISANSGGANLRTCGNLSCQSEGYMRNGTHVHMMCWEDTQWVYPPNSNYASPRWFKVSTLALGGSIGFVHSSLVAGQTSVPHC